MKDRYLFIYLLEFASILLQRFKQVTKTKWKQEQPCAPEKPGM